MTFEFILTPNLPYDFTKLHELEDDQLKKIGCQIWDTINDNGDVLWLFPAEWYDFIPNGLNIVDINMESESFIHGITDNDTRCGLLPYGFIKKSKNKFKPEYMLDRRLQGQDEINDYFENKN